MKKRLQTVLSVLLSVILLCSALSGCSDAGSSTPTDDKAASSGSEQTAPAGEKNGGDPTKIAFISYMAIDSAEFLQNLVAALEQFAEENSDSVEVKVIEATHASEYEPKIRTACDAGYEIIQLTTAWQKLPAPWQRTILM